tara:strand:+ start:1305 stop:2213 length:909 start_codon:yes stop_codon:yes gene_type:complete
VFNNARTSGKIVAATLFGVALLAFAVWESPYFKSKTTVPAVATSSTTRNLLDSEGYSTDSDNDGVRDWEEALLGLDPNNPDSNGNGITDGDELAAAREEFEAEKSTADASSTTQTDLLTREIFGAYIQSKQRGTYDGTAFDFIIAQATNSQFNTRYTTKYTLDDINTTPDMSPERILQYKQEFQDAIIPVTTITEYELTTYGRAIETGSETEFEKLVAAALVYDQIATTLLSLTVPEDAAQAHLDLVNSFSTFAKILSAMGSNPEDPILTFVATRNFIEGEDAIKTAYSQIDIYFTLKETAL